MRQETRAWLKGCLFVLGAVFFGWALVILMGYIILRGILSFMSLYDND